ncbi:MAG: hypothetical protein L3J08_05645 [Flavobacteriaceae bacterium]|nr:hypothetical protein [Flavobacteriaceae bacterium]
MENLDILKNVWKNQGESSIKFSANDLRGMIHKKSSSIVKWILIISILEFILPNLFFLFTDWKDRTGLYKELDLLNLTITYSIIHVLVVIGFIYIFFKNYKNISAESNVKTLLSNILKTRSTVKKYIYYNLVMGAIVSIHVFYIMFSSEIFKNKLPENVNMIIVWATALFILVLMLFIFWLFYRILYGILLKKLNKNYDELLKSE